MSVSSFLSRNACLLTIQRCPGAQKIFSTPLEYRFFLKLLKQYKAVRRVQVFAFCLLPSAIYVIAGGKDTRVICEFLSDINHSFCSFISVMNQAQCHMQIGRSRMIVVDDDRTLMDLVAFVESFPVRCGIVKRAQDYEWASFRLRAFGVENGVLESLGINQ